MIIGILLIATLVVTNTNGIAFAQAGDNVAGCAHTVKVTIYNLPSQTDEASTQVTLSNIASDLGDQGKGSISLPGIGSGQVSVVYNLHSNNIMVMSDLPGQTAVNDAVVFSGNAVCHSKDPQSAGLSLPGIGDGAMSITKVN